MSPTRLFGRHRLFRSVTRLVALLVATAAAGVTALTLSVAPAWASHFRAGELSWSRASSTTNVVTFEATASFRRDFTNWSIYRNTGGGTQAAPNVGDLIQDPN